MTAMSDESLGSGGIEFPTGVRLIRDVTCEMRDGTILLGDVYRPPGNGKHPVLLMRTPYGKAAAEANDVCPYAHPSWFAAHGYLVVVQDVRGRHASEGTFVPLANEVADGYDTIEWCTRLDGAEDAVGMYGFSYPGFVQLAAAASRHPALKCISPGFTAADAYQWAMKSSLPRLAFVVGWALGLAHDEAVRGGDWAEALRLWELSLQPALLYGRMPLLGSLECGLIERYMPFIRDWLTKSDPEDDYWVAQRFALPTIPAFCVAGWYDIWSKETIELYEAQASRGLEARLLVGPWAHAPWRGSTGPACQDCGPELTPSINHLLLEWLDWHLREKRPTSWLSSSGACWFDYGDRTWKTGDFPSADAHVSLFLRSDGLATVSDSGVLGLDEHSEGPHSPDDVIPDVIVSDPLIPTPSVGGWSCCYESMAPMGAKNQRMAEALSQVSVYTSPFLPSGTLVAGKPIAKLFVVLERVPATIIATLCLVRDGRSYNIARGVWRLERPGGSSVEWGEAEAEIEMSHVVLTLSQNDRLRLQVQCSSFPELAIDPHVDLSPAEANRTVVKRNTVMILHSGSHHSSLMLPAVPGPDERPSEHMVHE